MKIETMQVTPQQAKEWLRQGNEKNRNIRQHLVVRYADDMRSGAWHLTHQGIAFYTDGTLADGQHRLAAVILSGATIPFVITRNVPKESGLAIDMHAPRKVHDALLIGGAPKWLDKTVVSIVRVLLNDMETYQRSPSVDQINSYAIKWEDVLSDSAALLRGHKRFITTAPVGACYACAIYGGEDLSAVIRFAEVMRSGESNGPHENAAIRLREHLMKRQGASWQGAGERTRTIKRVQRAISAFCEHKPLSQLKEPEELIYPIPPAPFTLMKWGVDVRRPTFNKSKSRDLVGVDEK